LIKISPLPTDEWAEEQLAVFTRLVSADTSRVPDAVGIVLRHPELFAAWYPFGQVLQNTGRLPPRDREIVILRVAVHSDCAYVWAKHESYAGRFGLDPDEVHRVSVGAGAPGWTDWERVLICAADELCAHTRISQPTWSKLCERYDEAQLIEYLFLVGEYRLLSGLFNSIAIDTPLLEPLTAKDGPRR
jgi:4-carboxymuconolactone decarboxylase